MNLNVHGLMKWVRALAQNSNLGVRFYPADGEKRAPATDSKFIYVDHPRLEWNNEEIIKWQAGIYHEIGHNVPAMRDIFPVLNANKIDMKSFYGQALNIVDDHRQEHYKYDEYLQKQRVMNESQGIITKNIALTIKKELNKDKDIFKKREEAGMLLALLIADSNARKSWQSSSLLACESLDKVAPPEVTQYSDILKQPKWSKRFEDMTTAADVVSLVDDIIREVFKKDPEKEKKKKGSAKGKGKGKTGKQSIETAQKALGDKRGTPSNGELMEAMNKDQHLSEVEKSELGDGSGRSGLYSGTGEFVPLDQNEIEVVNGKSIDNLSDRERSIPWHPPTSLAKSVRRVLLSEKQTKRLHGQKRGKIDQKNVHRVTMKNAKGINERIFRCKTSQLDVDVAVLILQDCSGSMSGDKYELASNATVTLAEALNYINVPFQAAGFTDGNKVQIWKFKEFEEKFNKEKMHRRFEIVYRHMGNNDDPDSVLWAYNQLMLRPESRKILLVLSDGSPASSSNPTKVYEGLKTICEAIHKEKVVEIHGIGIQYSKVKNYYPSYEVINDVTELEPALLKLIHRKIIKPK